MKKIILFTLATLSLTGLLTGCDTTGLSLHESSGASYASDILNLPLRTNNLSAKPWAKPIRLAVAEAGEVTPPADLLNPLAARPELVASVSGLPLPRSTVNDWNGNHANHPPATDAATMESIGRLARATGADYVFVVGGNVDAWRKSSVWNLFDATLIGGAIVPATEIHVEGSAAGALVDASTGSPLFFVSTTVKHSAHSPDMLANGQQMEMTVAARDELAEKLAAALLAKLAATGQ